jgi:trehalose-6-phosphate synthase
MPFNWIGWPGGEYSIADQAIITKRLATEFASTPVFLGSGVSDAHYNGFSNSILWPLFHYHPV